MKNKKKLISICVVIILVLIIGIVLFVAVRKNSGGNIEKQPEIQENLQPREPDVIIKGTEEKPIKSKGFEVTNIEIFKTTETSLIVKATVVNKSGKAVNGFFIEIGLFDKEGKQVTKISQNYTKKIKPGKSYVIDASVVGLKTIKDITSAKLLRIEKETKASIQEYLNTDALNPGR